MVSHGQLPGWPPSHPLQFRRRRLLGGALALCGPGLLLPAAQAHTTAGRVEPRLPVPDWRLQLADGVSRPLAALLRGRITALQLMFTGCRATCPIQGAQFAQLQDLLLAQGASPQPGALRWPWQLLSVSIDALGDDPARMRQWLSRWAAGSAWRGGVAAVEQVDAWLDFLGARSRNPQDRHTAQVYLLDAQGRLAWRSTELPTPAGVAQTLRELQLR